MNNIRIDWIDLTKGIAIFLMVCGHTSIPLSISNWIWSFHMPLFFIISGILFNATKYPNFNLFIKKRGKTLIIPYIIFSLITLLTIHDQTLKEWLYKGWINGCALWFIPVLFFAEIFSYFIIRYINSNCLILLTAITIGTIGYMLYFFNIHFPYNIDVSFYASFFYLIGYISKNKIIHYPPKHSLAICLLIVNIILSQILPRTDMAWNNCGWYGLNAINAIGGTSVIAERYKDKLAGKFSGRFISECLELKDYTSTEKASAIAIDEGAVYMHAVSEGGLFSGLWEVASCVDKGIQVDINKIPIWQQVIEIAEFMDINPYLLEGSGSLLIVSPDGYKIEESLNANGIYGEVIGKITDNKNRVVINGDETRYLEPPRGDEIYKFI